MSTTFDVYPGSNDIPSFLELLCNTEYAVHNYLKSIGIDKSIKIGVEIKTNNEHIRKSFQLTDKMIWADSMYAWFFICDIPGGTDAYFYQYNSLDYEFLREELGDNTNFQKYHEVIENNIKLGYKWSFRRSVGQPAIVTLCYGFLAAALAKLTKGVLYTDDGAWDYKKFPADPDDFMRWYFRLEYVDRDSDIDINFIKESVSSIRKILS